MAFDEKTFSKWAIPAAILIWGVSFAVAKFALHFIDPVALVFFRLVIALAFILLVAVKLNRLGEMKTLLFSEPKTILVSSFVGVSLLWFLDNVGLNLSTTSMAAILLNTSPIFIFVLGIVFLKEKFSKLKFAGLAAGLLGIGLVLFAGTEISAILGEDITIAYPFFIGTEICWAVYTIMSKRLLEKYSVVSIVSLNFLFGALFYAPFALQLEDFSKISNIPIEAWTAVVFLGVFVSAVAVLAWNYGLKRREAGSAGSYLFATPVIATLISALFLREPVTLAMVFGGTLVLAGIYLMQKEVKPAH